MGTHVEQLHRPDAGGHRPGHQCHRHTAAEPANPLLGPIGRTVLDNLLPALRRQRVKARSRKNMEHRFD
jgi:hypothetical protein